MIPGTIRWIPPGVKRPQMQWNQLAIRHVDDPMFAGIGERRVDVLRALAARRAGRSDDGRRDVRVRQRRSTPRSVRTTCSPFSSTRRSRAAAVSRCSATSSRHRWCRGVSAAPVELYPAIDLRAGRVVRLTQGDYDAETVYGDDPVAVAASFAAAGASWIHVVDLDAARSGDPVNRSCVAAIVGRRRRSRAGADRRGSAHRRRRRSARPAGRRAGRDGLGGDRRTGARRTRRRSAPGRGRSRPPRG